MRVDAVSKVAELELAEKEKMKDKVERIVKHGCNVFINRYYSHSLTLGSLFIFGNEGTSVCVCVCMCVC